MIVKISLTLGISSRPPGRVRRARTGAVGHSVAAAVFARDHNICQCCGFRSLKFQQALVLSGSARDVDGIVTACIFCQQCFELEQVARMESGVLIWLPELSQPELNHLARDLYLARLQTGFPARCNRVLEFLVSRREPARALLGTDDPAELAGMLDETYPDHGRAADRLEGIRLFPLDRRIIVEEEIQYNQFPVILAYWRSRGGPYSGSRDFPWLERAERDLLGPDADPPHDTGPAIGASAPGGKTHAELASGLLRDAAVFFETLAMDNPARADTMYFNADLFRQFAERLERDPTGVAESDPSQPYAHMAAHLLEQAAALFDTVANQNPAIEETMEANARLFRQIGTVLRRSPTERLPD